MASSRKSKKPAGKKSDSLSDFFLKSSEKSREKINRSIKVGIVTALVGGIFKAMALTNTFPQPFDMLGNVVLFFAFLMLLFSFMFSWFS